MVPHQVFKKTIGLASVSALHHMDPRIYRTYKPDVMSDAIWEAPRHNTVSVDYL